MQELRYAVKKGLKIRWFLQLAAQAEAEKRNIGTVDSLHKEVDKYKNVIEEKESIHREFNKSASPCSLSRDILPYKVVQGSAPLPCLAY